MGYYGYGLRGRSYHGNARAERHAREGRETEALLGRKTIEHLKEWVYETMEGAGPEREVLVREYTRRFGKKAGSYLEDAWPRWRGGRQMSGMVMSRFLAIVPTIGGLDMKYRLVESMWDAQAGEEAGREEEIQEEGAAVAQSLARVRKENPTVGDLPERMKQRVKWLADADSEVYGRLKAWALSERQRIRLDATREQIRAALRTPIPEGCTRRIWLNAKTGKVRIELSKHVQLAEARPPEKTWWENGWLWAGAGILLLLLLSA